MSGEATKAHRWAAHRAVYPSAHESHAMRFAEAKTGLSIDEEPLLNRVATTLADTEAATEARVLRQIEALLFGGFFTDGKVPDAAIALAKRVAAARKEDLLPAPEAPKETP